VGASRTLTVGATAGVAELATDTNVESLVARADAAMYGRKRQAKANRE
jgi:PleD family two-component response regulator